MESKNKKFLLVDDDITIRELYEHAFRMLGYNIETAIDGQDAVDKLSKMEKLPDMILLDVMMPRMSGFDLLRYLRNSDRYKDVIVIMLTSLGDEETTKKMKSLGVSDYLVKTDYVPREVVVKVEEIIEKLGKTG